MSIREMWQVVLAPLVLMLAVMLGLIAGAASAASLHAAGVSFAFALLGFSVVTVLVTVASASLVSAFVYLRMRRGTGRIIVVPVAVTVFLSILPISVLAYQLAAQNSALNGPNLPYIIASVPIIYTVISDFFHHIVFRFIAPSIWGRAHVHEAEDVGQTAREKEAVNTQIKEQQVPEQRSVWIGKTQVSEAELLFLQAQGNYLRVVTQKAESLERFRISEAVGLLNDSLGLFVHRSNWVAFAGIQRVEQAMGQYRLVMRSGEEITVASTREKDVLRALEARGLVPA